MGSFVEEYALDGIPQDATWEEFGQLVANFDSVPILPNPAQFSDWRDWARRAMMMLD